MDRKKITTTSEAKKIMTLEGSMKIAMESMKIMHEFLNSEENDTWFDLQKLIWNNENVPNEDVIMTYEVIREAMEGYKDLVKSSGQKNIDNVKTILSKGKGTNSVPDVHVKIFSKDESGNLVKTIDRELNEDEKKIIKEMQDKLKFDSTEND